MFKSRSARRREAAEQAQKNVSLGIMASSLIDEQSAVIGKLWETIKAAEDLQAKTYRSMSFLHSVIGDALNALDAIAQRGGDPVAKKIAADHAALMRPIYDIPLPVPAGGSTEPPAPVTPRLVVDNAGAE